MEVFVLMAEWDYEGSALMGVYASEEEARNAHGVYIRDRNRFIDQYYIIRQVLGAYPDDIDYDRMYL